MKLIIDIPEEKYKTIQEGMYCGMLDADLYRDIKNGIPHETVTEFADRCRECGSKYGKLLKQEPKTGHWITHEESKTLLTGQSATGGVMCSECGYKTYNRVHVVVGCPYRWCPMCGARMVEP